MPPDSLEHRLRQAETYPAIERVLRSAKQRMEQHFENEGLSDVTPQQAKVLMLLFQEKRAVTGQFLSEKLAISAVTVSRFLRSLEENQWVERERDPKDARASLIRPTSKAYKALPRFIRISNDLMDEVFGHLPPEEFQRFAASVKQVQDQLEALDSTAS